MAYGGTGGRVPRYGCSGSRTDRGNTNCLSFGGVAIERAITDQVLAAVEPAGIEAALAAVEQLSQAHAEKRSSLELALEKARYEARRAERQYDATDPDNRLVAGELEARWDQALATITELEQDLAALESNRDELTDEQKQGLLRLGDDLLRGRHAVGHGRGCHCWR